MARIFQDISIWLNFFKSTHVSLEIEIHKSSFISNFNLLFGGKGKKCSFSIPCGIVKNEISLVERLLLCIFYTKKKKILVHYLLPKVITVIWELYSSDILKGKKVGRFFFKFLRSSQNVRTLIYVSRDSGILIITFSKLFSLI